MILIYSRNLQFIIPRSHTERTISEGKIKHFFERKSFEYKSWRRPYVPTVKGLPQPFPLRGVGHTVTDSAFYLFGKDSVRLAKGRRPVLPASYNSLSAGSLRRRAFPKVFDILRRNDSHEEECRTTVPCWDHGLQNHRHRTRIQQGCASETTICILCTKQCLMRVE